MVNDMAQKILVVDDEEGIVLLLKDYFELQGYEVITAGGGMEALARISCDPDMIILDINMPDLDGLSVCRKIREKVKSNTPIQKNALSGGAGAVAFYFGLSHTGCRIPGHGIFIFLAAFVFFSVSSVILYRKLSNCFYYPVLQKGIARVSLQITGPDHL